MGGVEEIPLLVFLLVGVYLVGGRFLGNSTSNKVLGDSHHPSKNNLPSPTITLSVTQTVTVSPSITITTTATPTDPTPMSNPTTVPTAEPTTIVTASPTVTQNVWTPVPMDQTSNSIDTQKTVELVPVSERSVTTNSNYIAPTVTTSVLNVIKNKFEQVGRGEILSKPMATPTPTPYFGQNKTENSDVLSGDVDIFYKLLGEKVLLGAENAEGKQLNIKDEDLRSAEITLNKVLDKNGLRLNLTSDNNFALVEDSVIALTTMPVHVNIDSHKIYLETAEGKKELRILPEVAVKQAVELKSFEKLSKDSAPSIVDLGEELAYKVEGDKTYKVFGYFNVSAKQNVYITAETGEVIEGDQPLVTKIVRLISL